jgi:HD-GYP domain-containing protein (c-di-GMP phosphodiesterase class II)
MVAVSQRSFVAEYHLDESKPQVDKAIRLSWQKIVDILATVAGVPVALVMEIHPHDIEVAVTSSSTPDNPYEVGEKAELGHGLYCETVLRLHKPLLVSNALQDETWAHNPDIDLGMIFYYGLPILWPDGTSFGTICILDRKSCLITAMTQNLLEVMRQSIELELKGIYQQQKNLAVTLQLNSSLEDTITSLVSVLSYRDPYTAKHQERVAELSVNIAEKLRLPDTFQHGLYLGATIHDIGKIYIPSEFPLNSL